MIKVFDSFAWWLLLISPRNSVIRRYLRPPSHNPPEEYFWAAIAPEKPISSPWEMAEEVLNDYLAPFPKEMRVLESTQIYLKHYI